MRRFMIYNKPQQWISDAWTSTWTLFYPLHVTQPPLSSFSSFIKVFIAACFEDKASQFMMSHDGLYVHSDSGLSVLHHHIQKIQTYFLYFKISSQQILVHYDFSVFNVTLFDKFGTKTRFGVLRLLVLCNFRDWWKIVWFCGRFQGFFIGFLGSDRVFGALRSGVLLLLGHWRTISTGFQGSWLSLVCSWWLFGLPGLPGVRHGSWRVSVGFMVVWFALYLKDGFLGFLSLMCSWWLPTIFKSLPWTLRCSSWTDREQGFRVLLGVYHGLLSVLHIFSRVVLVVLKVFFYGCLISI